MKENDLKGLFLSYIQDWINSLEKAHKKSMKKQKLLLQYKLLRDAEQIDIENEEVKSKSKGMGFVEVGDHDLALYLIRQMNNLIVNEKTNRGLILHFTIEDHRKIHKRELKLAKIKKLQDSKQKDGKQDTKPKRRRDKKAEEKSKVTIDQVTDIAVLKQMIKESNSRGKRNRIKRRIEKLLNPESASQKATIEPEVAEVADVEMADDSPEPAAKPPKLAKEVTKPQKSANQQIEDEIRQKVKRLKNKKRNQVRKDEEAEMNDIMKSFEQRINKRLKLIEEAGEDDQGFEEVEVSEE